jgi:hypothetical protein
MEAPMKTFALVLGMMMLLGCGIEEVEPVEEEGTSLAADPEVEAEIDELATCSSEGGTCRKSRCRAGEESNWDLECGTDAQCCVPVAAAPFLATCSSVGGTCRKSRCRTGEHLDTDYECGTDAACCVPNP